MIITAGLNFTLQSPIGSEGRNSEVFLATDHQLGATIVVKRIEKTKFNQPDDFFKEAQNMYATSHSNVVNVKYGCMDSTYIYLAMPLYKNGSLNSLINRRFLKVREIIKLSIDFLSGLHNVHSKKLVHFDIKPTNILIGDDGRGLLTDFGLAKYLNNYGLAIPDSLYDSHIAPEAFKTTHLSLSSDIYQAGLTLYRICNGNHIFDAQWITLQGQGPQAIISGIFPDRNVYLAHIPRRLRTIINKSLNLAPGDRYLTVIEMINDLSSINKCLDWEYAPDFTNNTFSWLLDLDNQTQNIRVCNDSGSWKVEGFKVMKATNKRLGINNWCNTSAKNLNNAIKFAESIIQKI